MPAKKVHVTVPKVKNENRNQTMPWRGGVGWVRLTEIPGGQPEINLQEEMP